MKLKKRKYMMFDTVLESLVLVIGTIVTLVIGISTWFISSDLIATISAIGATLIATVITYFYFHHKQ